MSHLSSELLVDYVHGGLAAEADAEVFTHLQACASCRADHADEIALTEILRSRAMAEERDFPDSLRLSICAAVAKPAAHAWPQRLAAFWRPALGAGAAVTAAALVFLVPHQGVTGTRTQLTASATLTPSAFFSHHDAAAADFSLAERTSSPQIEAAAFMPSESEEEPSAGTN
jgi:anti-sigma factor RsiW